MASGRQKVSMSTCQVAITCFTHVNSTLDGCLSDVHTPHYGLQLYDVSNYEIELNCNTDNLLIMVLIA